MFFQNMIKSLYLESVKFHIHVDEHMNCIFYYYLLLKMSTQIIFKFLLM